MAGLHAKVSRTSGGQTVTLAPVGGQWRHPWYTRLSWVSPLRQWVATVEPGYVNGRMPIYETTVREAEMTPEYGINPLSGERFFSASVFQRKGGESKVTRRVQIPLYMRPAIRLTWRKLGFDGDAAVPEFFALRGVQPPPPSQAAQLLGGGPINISKTLPRAGMRLLRACDIVLHQPRMALTSHVTIEPGIVTGISNVTQTLSLRSQAPEDRLKIFATSRHDPADPLQAGINPLGNDYEEPTWDELLVATVYVLSPPGTPVGSEPDADWVPYIRHHQFWNLSHAQPRLRALVTDPSIPYIPPLAGGAAQLVVNFLTASLNDATQRMLNILTAHSMAGRFWTPTGGGSTSEFPREEAQPPSGNGGLDKDGRLQAQRAARAKASRMTHLDPEFPYRAEPFDPTLLDA